MMLNLEHSMLSAFVCKICIFEVQVQHVLCFMQFLSESNVSVNMIANYLLALKAKFIVHGLMLFSQSLLKSLKAAQPNQMQYNAN